ncbi:hypothetical protein E2C01_019864 [Portunus trituberculatus]|uniref:Uncharacterized protein n=1 Tax=Portunus trituberculatus TaxID=210409 RepID=A0A5B7E062_PORTR|nr:hypothetical protein [Portunus trituberculatus]
MDESRISSFFFFCGRLYSTNQSNNNLILIMPSCYHPETCGDMLPWSEITVPLVTCHLPPAICHV